MIGLLIWSYAYAQGKLNEPPANDSHIDQRTDIEQVDRRKEPIYGSLGIETHPILSPSPGNPETVRQYLASKNSPLANNQFTVRLLDSPYWSTIIAITDAEESFSINPTCQATGKPSNNLYGQLINGRIRCFDSILDGFNYENDWLTRHEEKHPTIESLNGYYVQPASSNWLNTVLKIKQEVESL